MKLWVPRVWNGSALKQWDYSGPDHKTETVGLQDCKSERLLLGSVISGFGASPDLNLICSP